MKKFVLVFLLSGSYAAFSQVLYDQSNYLSGYGSTSTYMVDVDALVQTADDFVVPAGETWEIDSITIYGFRNVAGPSMDSVRVEFFTDNSGMPGSGFYSGVYQLGPDAVTAVAVVVDLVLDIPDQTLTEGTYWLSVSGYTPSESRWFWLGQEGALLENEAMVVDHDDVFGAGLTSWTTMSDAGIVDDNVAFSIHGTSCCLDLRKEKMVAFSAYPNPVKDVLYMESEEKISSVNIYSITGSLVLQPTVNNNSVNVAELESGIYFLQVESAAGKATLKFVKE